MKQSIRLATERLSVFCQTSSWKSLNHRFLVGDLTKVDKLCHENVIAHRIRELQNHFPSGISMPFLLLDVTEAVGIRGGVTADLSAQNRLSNTSHKGA